MAILNEQYDLKILINNRKIILLSLAQLVRLPKVINKVVMLFKLCIVLKLINKNPNNFKYSKRTTIFQ